MLENITNIRVPVIAAIEGRAYIHSDHALLAIVIVAAGRGRPSKMWGILPWVLCRVTESLPRGVIARELDERRPSCSTRCRRVPPMIGE